MNRTNSHLAAFHLIFLGGVLSACGGATPSPQQPDSQEPVLAPPPMDEDSEVESEDELEEQPIASDDSQPITSADLQGALQVVFDDDAMRTALNLEEPGRFPLKITGSDLPSDLEVTMIGAPVEVVDKPDDPKKEAVLIFTRVTLQGNSASFKFRYDVAGIRGSSTATRTDGRWELKTSRFSEYMKK